MFKSLDARNCDGVMTPAHGERAFGNVELKLDHEAKLTRRSHENEHKVESSLLGTPWRDVFP